MTMVAEGALQPVIHAVRPLGQLPQAMQELMDRQVFGKSVVTL